MQSGHISELFGFRAMKVALESISTSVWIWRTGAKSALDQRGVDFVVADKVNKTHLVYVQVKESWHTMEAKHFKTYARNGIYLACDDFRDRGEMELFWDLAETLRVSEWARSHAFKPEDFAVAIGEALQAKGVMVSRAALPPKKETLGSLLLSIRNR